MQPNRVSGNRREEGVANLWRGVGPNVARNAIINAAELASYDQACPLPCRQSLSLAAPLKAQQNFDG